MAYADAVASNIAVHLCFLPLMCWNSATATKIFCRSSGGVSAMQQTTQREMMHCCRRRINTLRILMILTLWMDLNFWLLPFVKLRPCNRDNGRVSAIMLWSTKATLVGEKCVSTHFLPVWQVENGTTVICIMRRWHSDLTFIVLKPKKSIISLWKYHHWTAQKKKRKKHTYST